MKGSSTISIIVPSFNQGRYIEKTILSVLNQSYADWELIIQDSCSTDETAEVCNRYQSTDSRIRFFQEKDKGFADAVNKALIKATGVIGAIQSSDDYYAHADVFSQVAGYYSLNKNLDLLTSGSRMVDSDYRFIESPTLSRKAGMIDPIDAFRLYDHFAQGSTFFRISRVKEIGGLRPEFDMVADTDLWVRLANYKPVNPGALLRVDGIWSHLIMHVEQRSADQVKFYIGRCNLYSSYLNDERMHVPDTIKKLCFQGHLADTYQYLVFKNKTTSELEEIFTGKMGHPIPFRWKLKKSLLLIPAIRKFYFRHFKDNDSAFLLEAERTGNALWFKTQDLSVSKS